MKKIKTGTIKRIFLNVFFFFIIYIYIYSLLPVSSLIEFIKVLIIFIISIVYVS